MTPPFPTTLAELAPWRVYADQLLERGERLGSYLSSELSLGDAPSKDQLTSLHKQALRVCRVAKTFEATWLLGHVRTLTVIARPQGLLLSRAPPEVSDDALLGLRDLFRKASAGHLQELTVTVSNGSIGSTWNGAMSHLPSTCATLRMDAVRLTSFGAAKVLEGIPPWVETLRLARNVSAEPWKLIDDRFSWVDLREYTLSRQSAGELLRLLERNLRLKVRLGSVTDGALLRDLGERAELGTADDARLVNERTGGVMLLERATLNSLQRRYGVVTVFAQLGRLLPEAFGVRAFQGQLDASAWLGSAIVRRADGTWSIRAEKDGPRIALESGPLDETPVPLAHGSRVFFDDQPWRFERPRCDS